MYVVVSGVWDFSYCHIIRFRKPIEASNVGRMNIYTYFARQIYREREFGHFHQAYIYAVIFTKPSFLRDFPRHLPFFRT